MSPEIQIKMPENEKARDLTLYIKIDPKVGRWITIDPAGAGINHRCAGHGVDTIHYPGRKVTIGPALGRNRRGKALVVP